MILIRYSLDPVHFLTTLLIIMTASIRVSPLNADSLIIDTLYFPRDPDRVQHVYKFSL